MAFDSDDLEPVRKIVSGWFVEERCLLSDAMPPARDLKVIRSPELLYQTTDPTEVPLVMPTWARQVPVLAALIDEGHRRRAERESAAAPSCETAAEHGVQRD